MEKHRLVLKKFKVIQLRKLIRQFNLHNAIKGYSKMRKADLIESILEHKKRIFKGEKVRSKLEMSKEEYKVKKAKKEEKKVKKPKKEKEEKKVKKEEAVNRVVKGIALNIRKLAVKWNKDRNNKTKLGETLSKYKQVSQKVRNYIEKEHPKLHKLLAFMEEKRLENLEKKNNK